MKEIKTIIEDLESIFSVVNSTSEESAITLMSVIQRLEKIKDNVGVTPDDILEILKAKPEHFLTELMKTVGPSGVFKALSNMMGFGDDMSIISKSVPSLDTYPLDRLKTFEKELEKETDPISRYLLHGVRKHITRREEKTE